MTGYNLKAESALVASLGEAWVHIHFGCLVHLLAGVHQRVFKFMKKFIDGMVATSLSLNNSGMITHFRSAFRRVLKRLLVFRREPLSQDATAYRKVVLDSFCGKDIRCHPLRLCLLKLAGGDWRSPGVFEYVPDGGETVESVHKTLCEQFVPT